MPFSLRNAFYLRISKNTVLPTYIYLDERHLRWMSETILQYVLSDMRPQLLSKLKAEANISLGNPGKKAIDIHRGETYQFCYFLRKTEPHSVIVKTRTFRAVQARDKREQQPQNDKKGKRKNVPKSPTTPKTRTKRPRIYDEPENAFEVEDANTTEDTRVSPIDNAYGENFMNLDQEEDGPKPLLSLEFQGFSILGHCLCVVVEPWPTIRTMAEPTRSTPTLSQDQGRPQNRDPLFLPEEPESRVNGDSGVGIGGERYVNTSYLERVLNDTNDSDDENVGGMVEFSQVLQNIGDSRAGAMNDDEDMSGSVLFGDADEHKEF